MNPYRQEEMGKYAMEIPVEALGALEASRATAPQPRREPEMAQAVRRLNDCTKDLRLNLQALTVILTALAEARQQLHAAEQTITQLLKDRDAAVEEAAHKEMDAFNLSQRLATVQQQREQAWAALRLILPLAKGYANMHRGVEVNYRCIKQAEASLVAEGR